MHLGNGTTGMNEGDKSIQVESIPFAAVADRLRRFPSFEALEFEPAATVGLIRAPEGATIVKPGQTPLNYWIVLEGRAQSDRPEPDGTFTIVGFAAAGEGFGETPLMHGKAASSFLIRAVEDSLLVRFGEQQFWNMLSCCLTVRKVIIKNMTERLQAYQVEALHREKLVSLGTLAAGLMHELHNPGSAAKRSAAQLREHLMQLQDLSLRFSQHPKTQLQLNCMKDLLAHTVRECRMSALSSLDQLDAEEAMSEWLAGAGVQNAYTIGPALVGIGFKQEELSCAREYFDVAQFSDTLNWLGALVCSVSEVCAIEESISRISDLVTAVKKFAYDERSPQTELDVHDSLQSTLTILSHKLRIKQIGVKKQFDASPSTIETRGSALSQVWTNLIDNAADASPANGQIEIATWTEDDWLVVRVCDHGPGIPSDVLPHIFEAFFTTKPQGSGTGLGLEIVHRIVTKKFGGSIQVESQPGNTTFTVRLPKRAVPAADKQQNIVHA